MHYFLLTILFTSVFFSILILLSLPVLLGRGVKDTTQKIQNLKPIALSGKILFVSDFHLRDPKVRVNLATQGISSIVIVGDFFDSERHFKRFGETLEERIENGLSVFLSKEFQGDIYFISAYTHDPQLEQFELEYEQKRFFHVGKMAKFSMQGTEVVALHGNELHDGVFGGGISWFMQKIGFPLPLERLGKQRFKIPQETWFLAGHSHVPALHQESKTANTGSFVGVPLNKLIFHIPIGTGVVIENGEVELMHFNTPPSSNMYSF